MSRVGVVEIRYDYYFRAALLCAPLDALQLLVSAGAFDSRDRNVRLIPARDGYRAVESLSRDARCATHSKASGFALNAARVADANANSCQCSFAHGACDLFAMARYLFLRLAKRFSLNLALASNLFALALLS